MDKKADRILYLIVLSVSVMLIGADGTLMRVLANQTQSTNANNQQKQAAPQVPSTKGPKKETAKPVEVAPVTPNSSTEANQTPASQETTPATPATPRKKGRRQTRTASSQTAAATATTPTEQPDLSGTYAGVMNCPDAGVTGDTTLTVTGNQFTLSNGPSGRIVASTTQGYTAVVMQFGEAPTAVAGQPPPAPPKIVSFRGKKSGNRLTLSPVAGGSQCSFTPSSGMARSRGG